MKVNMRQFTKYISIIVLVLTCTRCTQEEPLSFTDKPSFDFVNEEGSAPLGFVSEPSINFTVDIALVGNILNEDKRLLLRAEGNARENVDYRLPEFVIFPKDTAYASFEIEILKAPDIEDDLEGKSLILSFVPDEEHVAGIKPKMVIKIEGDMPSQWIGYNFWFDFFFVPCTKARYRYLYEKLEFIDFSTHPGFISSSYQMLQATREYLQQQIRADNEERQALGLEPLKDDDGTDLTF